MFYTCLRLYFKQKRTMELPMWTYKSTSKQGSQASTLICHEALTVSLVGLREKWEYELRAEDRSLGKGEYFMKKTLIMSFNETFYFRDFYHLINDNQASSWLSCLEHRLRDCVLQNIKGSSPCLYQID